MKKKIIIVDEFDEIIGHKEAADVVQSDIYRVSALWITNSNGEILLAKRALTKKHSPGKWGPAVAGTVDEGETYTQNIVKEAEEEIGLKNISPLPAHKYREKGEHNYFGQWFTLILDQPIGRFVPDTNEVAEVRWFTKSELLGELEKHPDAFLKGMKSWVQAFSY